MADDKLINQLDSANALTGSEEFPVFQSGETRQALISQVYQLVLSLINSDVIPQGSNNLYFTNMAADARVALHANRTDNPHSVTAAQLGISNTASLKGNLSANINPNNTNDASQGYAVGSLWINTSNNSIFYCVANTNGGAAWVDISNLDVTKQAIGLGNVENTALSQFAGSTNITTIADSAVTSKTGLINHDALLNYVMNKHIDHSTVSVITDTNSGLSGGGDITTNRSIKIDPSTLSSLNSNQVDPANDLVMIYDASANVLRVVSPNTILAQNTSSNIPVPLRNNLLAGSTDINQIPNYLGIPSETGNTVSVNTGNKSFALTAANGFGVGGSIDPYYYSATQIMNNVVEAQYQYLFAQYNGSSWNFGAKTAPPQYRRVFNPRPYVLLHFESTFADAYGNSFSNTGVTISTTAFKWGASSARFNGSAFLANTAVDNPMPRWEMDFWANPDSFTNSQTLIHWGGSANSGIKLSADTSGNLILSVSGNGTSFDLFVNTSSLLPLVSGTWNHVRVNFDSQVYRVFLGGNLVTSFATATRASTSNSWQLRLGTDFSNTTPFTGYIDEFRFNNGFTRAMDGVVPSGAYVEDADWFDTVNQVFKHGGPTTGWTIVPTCYFGEAFAGNWNLLSHFDGVNNSTIFNELHGHYWQVFGTPKISTTQSKFGGSSLLLNGTTDYLKIQDATLNNKRNAFEIDFWFLAPNTGTQTLFSWGNNNFGIRLDITSGGNLSLMVSSNGTSYDIGSNSGVSTLSNSIWYNARVVFNGSVYTLYLNGTTEISYTSSTLIAANNLSTFSLGSLSNGANFFSGYIDELRISAGYNITNAPYTVATNGYANSQFTSVNSVLPYIAMGVWEEEIQTPVQFDSSNVYSHYLGTNKVTFTAKLRCLHNDLNYVAGEIVDLKTQGYTNQNYGFDITVLDSMTYSVTIGSAGLILIDKITHAVMGITATNWALIIEAKRGF